MDTVPGPSEGDSVTAPDKTHIQSAQKPLLSNDEIFGHYRIQKLLGRGGMGEVYECEDLENGRRLALKILRPELVRARDRARFLREGRLAASVNHPNSVYVFGTEEVRGLPVITMELVSGGSLKAYVDSHGPLPSARAVDIILPLIAGLDAVHAAGILHRDIKPSNCFIDADGQVKIGDYGLSISISSLGETQISSRGDFVGTPAFASPEQLRGEHLDIRSDIYSLAATLYFMLTGRPPFDSDGVNLMAAILTKRPEPLTSVRNEIPKRLSDLVMRCLEKDPDARIQDYATLQEVLSHFSSVHSKPAPLGLRIAAGMVDYFLLALIQFAAWSVTSIMSLPLMFLMAYPFSQQFPWLVAGYLLPVTYYTVTEGRWGTSLGKAICRIQVCGLDSSVPGIRRTFLRASVFTVPLLVQLLFAVIALESHWQSTTAIRIFQLLFARIGSPPVSATVASWIAWLSLFATARPENGFAAIHDRISRTRVMAKRPPAEPVYAARSSRISRDHEDIGANRFGPYVEFERLTEEVRFCLDPKLRRDVWVRLATPDTPAISGKRRDLKRSTRLRWLSGKRAQGESWDAYGIVEGRPASTVLFSKNPWRSVRKWLKDLVDELEAGIADGTLPQMLTADHLWITQYDRLCILDFPARSTNQTPATNASDLPSILDFIRRFGVAALEGRSSALTEDALGAPHAPLPLGAAALFRDLESNTIPNLTVLAERIEPLASKDISIFKRRIGQLAFLALLPTLVSIPMFLPMMAASLHFRSYAPQGQLNSCLLRLETIEFNDDATPERMALEVYIASELRNTATEMIRSEERAISQEPPFPGRTRRLTTLKRILEIYRNPSISEIQSAKVRLAAFIRSTELQVPPGPVMITCGLLFLMVVMALVSGTVFRGGATIRLFGMAVVTQKGNEVSQPRAFLRTLITWSPVLLLCPVAAGSNGSFGEWGVIGGVFLIMAIASIRAAAKPERSLQDRLAGTTIVRR